MWFLYLLNIYLVSDVNQNCKHFYSSLYGLMGQTQIALRPEFLLFSVSKVKIWKVYFKRMIYYVNEYRQLSV